MISNNKKLLKPTIGLEIHVELATKSKMFCGCNNSHFSVEPNTHTCPVCLGLPGALPVPNKLAIDWTLMIASALKCKISQESKFDRKHYFYPDLPKAYQISQYDEPLSLNGYLDTNEGRVGITRVHLEEDTGKLVHKKIKGKKYTLIDFNRSGVPLVEIVTDPDIHSSKQAKDFSQKLRTLIRWLEVSGCDMEKGSMRLEANVSWGKKLGYKVEVKNLNSFRFVERAIEYELKRQKKLLAKGETPKQETRGWDEARNKTVSQRYKETEEDYRYFPEPDIPPIRFRKREINRILENLPELPNDVEARFKEKLGIKEHFAEVLTSRKELADFAEKAFEIAKERKLEVSEIASIIVNQKINISKIKPETFIEKIVKQKMSKVIDTKKINKWVNESVKLIPKAAEDYKKGKNEAISALIGQVMKLSKGKADPQVVKKLLIKRLKKVS